METMSREILDMILDHALDRSPRGVAASYATVSRKWQIAIEARTMKSIMTQPDDQFQLISTIFSAKSPHRRAALRNLCLCPRAPTTGRTLEDAEANDAWFEELVSTLFQELKIWEEHLLVSNQGYFSPHLELELEPRAKDFCANAIVLRETAFLNFRARTPVLPQISMVVHLKMMRKQGMCVHPAALCHIATNLPSLEEVNYEFHEPTLKVNTVQREPRQALTDALQHFKSKLPRLSRLLIREPPSLFDYMLSRKATDLATVASGVNRFSHALRELCEAGILTELVLNGPPLSASLFMRTETSAEFTAKQPSLTTWPSMKRLLLNGNAIMVNGQWFGIVDDSTLVSALVPKDLSRPLIMPEDLGAFSLHQETQESDTTDQQGVGDSTDEDDMEHLKTVVTSAQAFDSFVEITMQTATQGMPSLHKFLFTTGLAPAEMYMAANENLDEVTDPRRAFLDKPRGQWQRFVERAERGVTGRRFIEWVASERWDVPEPVLEMCREWVGETGLLRLSRYT